MHAFSIVTFAAVAIQLATAHSYLSSPPCFNCPARPAAKAKDVKLLSDPLKEKMLCRGITVPAAKAAHRVSGDQLEVGLTAVVEHPGVCTFSLMDANLKNEVTLSTEENCLAKGGKKKFTVPLNGATGIKVLRYQWDEGKEHYENCALIRITGPGAPKAKGKAKAKAKAKAKGKAKAPKAPKAPKAKMVAEEAEAEPQTEKKEDTAEDMAEEPVLMPAPKRAAKSAAVPAAKAPANKMEAVNFDEDDTPSMAELDALFSGQEPQEAGRHRHHDDDADCTVGEFECHGDGFRQCGPDGEWIYQACGDNTTCTWLPATKSVACAHA